MEDNQQPRTRTAHDAQWVERRFRDYTDLILRFVIDLAVTELANSAAESQ